MITPAPGVIYIIMGDTILAEATPTSINIERDIAPLFLFEDDILDDILDEDPGVDYPGERDPETRQKPGSGTLDPRATRRGGRDPPSFLLKIFAYYIYIVYICLINERDRGRITPQT